MQNEASPPESVSSSKLHGLSWWKFPPLTVSGVNTLKWLRQQIARSWLLTTWLIGFLWSRRWLVGTTLACTLLWWLTVVLRPEPTTHSEFAVDDDVLIFDDIDQPLGGDENSTGTARPQSSVGNVAATAGGLNLSDPFLETHDQSGPFFLPGNAKSVSERGHGPPPSPQAAGQSIPEWPVPSRAVWLTGTIEEVDNSAAVGRTASKHDFLRPRQ